jgi:hypothetical protein
MSHHIVRDDTEFKVVVGWDPPLQTFFVQVHDQTVEDEEKKTIVFEGTCPGEYVYPMEVKRRVRDWVALDDQMLMTLYSDRELDRA